MSDSLSKDLILFGIIGVAGYVLYKKFFPTSGEGLGVAIGLYGTESECLAAVEATSMDQLNTYLATLSDWDLNQWRYYWSTNAPDKCAKFVQDVYTAEVNRRKENDTQVATTSTPQTTSTATTTTSAGVFKYSAGGVLMIQNSKGSWNIYRGEGGAGVPEIKVPVNISSSRSVTSEESAAFNAAGYTGISDIITVSGQQVAISQGIANVLGV